MYYFYYLSPKLSDESVSKQMAKIKVYYPLIDNGDNEDKIVGISEQNDNYPASLYRFPETLLVNGYEGGQKCVVILDNTYQVSKDREQFIKYYAELYKNNVFLSFYKFPYLDTLNVLKIIAPDSTNVDIEELKRVVSILFDILVSSIQAKKEERSYILAFAQEHGSQVGRTRGRKATVEKIEKLKDFIVKNSEDFEGELSDTDVRELLEKESFNVSRNTYYRYKAELRKEMLDTE